MKMRAKVNTRTVYKSEKASVDGIEFTVQWKKIKSIILRIDPKTDKLYVSAPLGVPMSKIQEMVQKKKDWILKQQRLLGEPKTALSKGELSRRREALRARIEMMLASIEQSTGLRAQGFQIRDMSTRWGSCNTRTHHLNFALNLYSSSNKQLEYVILHELVHTIVPNHGKDFYSKMDELMPDWRNIRKSLNKKT